MEVKYLIISSSEALDSLLEFKEEIIPESSFFNKDNFSPCSSLISDAGIGITLYP